MMPVLTFGELNVLVFAAFVFGLALAPIYHTGKFFLLLIFGCRCETVKSKAAFFAVRFFTDLFFGMIATVFAVVLFSSYGKGQMRLIAILSMAFGFVLWHVTVGRLTLLMAVWFKKAVRKFAEYVYNKALYPIIKYVSLKLSLKKSKIEAKKDRIYHQKSENELIGVITGAPKIKRKVKNEKHK